MELNILKIKLFAKTALIVLILTRIISTILMVAFISFDLQEFLIPFSNFSFLYSLLRDVTNIYEVIKSLLIRLLSIIGWPISVVLLVTAKKKIWLPTVTIILMSVINIGCCIESILSYTVGDVVIKTAASLYPHKVINIAYSSIMLLISIVYIISHIIEHKQNQVNTGDGSLS